MEVLNIVGEIGWDITSGEVKSILKRMNGDIEVHIASGGGSVFDGVEMFNAIKGYSRGKTTAKISSIGASMASYIPLACDEVLAHDNASFMIHNVSTFAWGDHKDLRKSADLAEGLTELLANEYVKKTDMDKAKILEMMDAETWLFGEEIVAMGFADGIVDTEGEKEKSSMFATAKMEFNNCMKSAEEHHKGEDQGEKMVAMMKTLGMGENPLEASATTQLEKNSKKEFALDIQAKLEESNTKLTASIAEVATLTASLEKANATVASLEAKVVTVGESAEAKAVEVAKAKAVTTTNIVAMAYEKGASKDTALKMLEKDTIESAGMILLEANGSNGSMSVVATGDGEPTNSDALMAYAEAHKGSKS